MNTLKTAVIGLGRIGWETHVPETARHAGFELVAVVDPLPERLAEAREQFGVTGYAGFDELLARETLDLIVIASPTHLHAPQAIAAMERGIDVFCDKPMAPTLEDVDAMIAAKERTGRKLMGYQPHRATAEVAAVRHIIDSGLLGPVYMIKRAWSNYVRRNDWQALQQYGGGMLNNYGAHLLDQVLYLSGAKATKIAGHLRAIATLGDADDVVKVLLELDTGMVCDIDISMASAARLEPWCIMGQRGSATFDPQAGEFRLKYFVASELADLQLNPRLAANQRSYDNFDRIPWRDAVVKVAQCPPVAFYDKVYDYFAAGAAPFVPVDETREVMRIIRAVRDYAGWA